MEFCSLKDDEAAVSWNEIDVNDKLDWYGSQDLHLEWRKIAMENILSLILVGVEIYF